MVRICRLDTGKKKCLQNCSGRFSGKVVTWVIEEKFWGGGKIKRRIKEISHQNINYSVLTLGTSGVVPRICHIKITQLKNM
jgi:hypothetical protein